MEKARIMLNLKKPGNSAFVCLKNRVHLTLANPIGEVSVITREIKYGLKGRYPTLIDLDNVINIEENIIKQKNNVSENEEDIVESKEVDKKNSHKENKKEIENKEENKTPVKKTTRRRTSKTKKTV